MRNSVRNLMRVGRYAEKMQWSEAKWNLFEMPAIDMLVLCIPAECDNIKLPIECEIASRGMRICYAIFAGISLRLCSISLRSFRITFAAYLPTHIKSLRDFFQSLLNYHRDNLYIISLIIRLHVIVNKRGKWSIKL